ncbi:MAG: hypothetical protein Q8L30_00165 [bacterium]|nr:hypothetical protein [bacterium]
MRKIAIWALVALLFPMVALATTVNVGTDGTVWIQKPVPSVTKIEIDFGPGVLERGDYWKQAVLHPKVVMPIKAHTVRARDGLFYVKKTEVTDVGIVYDGKKSVGLVHDVVGAPELTYTPYVLGWIVSVILMALGVWAFLKKAALATTAALAALATTATVAAFATIAALAATVGAFAIVATTVAAFVLVAVVEKRHFFLTTGIYAACMTASMVGFLLS